MPKKIYKLYFFLTPIFLGVLSSFTLPPYNFFIINFITFPLLFYFFYSNYKISKLKSFFIGWLFGYGYFFSSLFWISNSLKFDPSLEKLIIFTIFLIPAFMSIFYGFFTFVLSFFKFEMRFSSVLLFSLLLSIVEFIRGLLFGGFPWNLITFSLVELKSFLQILSIVGTYSLNLFSITIFCLPIIYFLDNKNIEKIYIFSILSVLIALNFVYGNKVIGNNKFLPKLTINPIIKVIAPNFKMERYYFNEPPQIKVDELFVLTEINQKDTLYVYPEGLINNINFQEIGFYFKNFSEKLSEESKVIIGINTNSNKKLYNSLVLFDKKFNILKIYNKNKLVPFGEHIPLENILKKFGLKKVTFGYTSFTASKERETINVGSFSFLPLICYEIIFSGNLSKQNKNYDFILNISEDGWFGDSIGIVQHFSHSIFRSIEEGKDVIRVTNNGVSAHVNNKGFINQKIDSTIKGTFEINSISKPKETIFSKYGNKIFFCLIFLYITLIFLLKKKNN